MSAVVERELTTEASASGARSDWRAGAAAIAAAAARHADAVDREGRFPAEAVQAMRDSGLLAAWVPKALGGPGHSLREIAAMCHQIGAACGASGMIFAMHQIKLSSVVHHAGSSAWYRQLQQRVVAESLLLGSVTSEVGVGGDIRRSLAAVQRDGDHFSLQKHGSVVSYGAYADALLITARADEQAPPNGQVMVTVLKDQYQLEKTGQWDAMGMRGTCSDAFMIRAQAPAEQIFEAPFADIIANTMLPVSHILWASVWFGIANSALLRVRAHLRAAMKAGGGNLPAAATQLPDLVAQMQLLHARLQSAITRFEAALATGHGPLPMSLTTDLTLLKSTMSEGCLAVVQQSLSTVGFAGYRTESPAAMGRHLRDLHSAPLMINNARLIETMSSFLLLDPLQFGLA
ncbi:acyl-CoA/acyl-ACP dehydrogenase [Curvibacter sp. RS43]|uniref:acyl-CoA dehydrogenase family protein n=1 Tax=Curvibacter microcysteis TaxID=3026419 RepID=UPI0023630C9D|nr:acyl-CoA dehydrogenase family protein [Curvibacter sp. RS43]MDD0809710.1 acyl-CoA/acyl-ACP dehydrogenase [Curvibacter sp. RS43]